MKQVAIYTRVSTEDQDCARQLLDLEAFASRCGYTVVARFTETASGTKNDRKQRAACMALAQARKIDAILVTELTRWGRSTMDLLQTLQELADRNVSLIAETGVNFDLDTAMGKLMLTLTAALSQFERDLISERTKSGLVAAKAKGKTLGRPVGNRTAPKHRKAVLKHLADGKSIRWIAHELHISKDTVMFIKSEQTA